MQYIQGSDRWLTFFTTLDKQAAADNAVRLVDSTARLYNRPGRAYPVLPNGTMAFLAGRVRPRLSRP